MTAPPTVEVTVDGHTVRAPAGVPVAVLLLDEGVLRFRASVTGAPRAPLCGMGICFECRVTIDGVPHRRACLVPCVDGMVVETARGAHA